MVVSAARKIELAKCTVTVIAVAVIRLGASFDFRQFLPIGAARSRNSCSTPIVLCVQCLMYGHTDEQWFVRELRNKNGDVPKSPFPTMAALVPSAGTIKLHTKLHS